MPRLTGFVQLNLEHEGEEVSDVIALIRKLPDVIEFYNSSISIKNKNRVSKKQINIADEWYVKADSFSEYLKGVSI